MSAARSDGAASARRILHRYRWVIFAVCAIGLVAAAVYSRATQSSSKVAGVLAPTPGPNSNGYIAAQRAYLARVATSDPSKPSGALVSLSKMTRASDAEGLRPAAGKLTAIFVRFPASQPEAITITTNVADAMNERATELQAAVRAEIDGLNKELPTATAARRKEIGVMLAQRVVGLKKLTGDCACVYALVIERSTLSSLAQEQGRSGVRLVDIPDPPVASLHGWQLTPLLPEK